MQIRALRFDELSDAHLAAWSDLQSTGPLLADPFFSAEYVAAVAAERSHSVEVGIVEDGGRYVGFLPFERMGGGVAVPVGGHEISEVHGFIADESLEVSPERLLQDLQLKAWHYECVPASQRLFAGQQFARRDFPYIDLSAGFEAYHARRRDAGSSTIGQALRKARKIERELGPLRVVPHTDDDAAFGRLMEWKSAQYDRTASRNVFRLSGAAALLHRLRNTQSANFAGMLSAMFAGDQLLAVHFGLRSKSVLAWCFPTYNPHFDHYSPGLVFLVMLLRELCAAGITRVDLGTGPERYKQSLQSDVFEVCEGVLDRRRVSRFGRRLWTHGRDWANNSSWARTPLRLFRRLRNGSF